MSIWIQKEICASVYSKTTRKSELYPAINVHKTDGMRVCSNNSVLSNVSYRFLIKSISKQRGAWLLSPHVKLSFGEFCTKNKHGSEQYLSKSLQIVLPPWVVANVSGLRITRPNPTRKNRSANPSILQNASTASSCCNIIALAKVKLWTSIDL